MKLISEIYEVEVQEGSKIKKLNLGQRNTNKKKLKDFC